MGRSSAAAARTVTAAVPANPSQAVRFSSAIGSMPWSTKPPARSVRRQHRLGRSLRRDPDRLDLGAGDGLAVLAGDGPPDIHAPRQFDRRQLQLGNPAPGHCLGQLGHVGRLEEGRGDPDRPADTAGHARGGSGRRMARGVGHDEAVAAEVAVEDDLHARDRPLRPLLAHEAADDHRLAQRDRDLGRSAGLHDQPLGSPRRAGAGLTGGSNSSSSATIPAAMAGIANRP